jgi:hypothetical protein
VGTAGGGAREVAAIAVPVFAKQGREELPAPGGSRAEPRPVDDPPRVAGAVHHLLSSSGGVAGAEPPARATESRPTIRVTIGTVEVRAQFPPPQPPRSVAPPESRAGRALADYLRRRDAEARS